MDESCHHFDEVEYDSGDNQRYSEIMNLDVKEIIEGQDVGDVSEYYQ